ncbi:MAPEG family protein [Pseudaestuariivita sp.]|uniref:MAPEG family protein n=1 Tax=Pseudaestuariivita sp. TaxID=2211669 RepID=UPI004058B2E7
MGDRRFVFVGVGAALVWTALVIYLGGWVVVLPVFSVIPTIFTAFLAPGLVLMAMMLSVVMRRYSDDAMVTGGALQGAAAKDNRALTNTVEQLVLAACIWPAVAILLGGTGPGMILVLGLAFAVSRIFYWIGFHRAGTLRVFGFAAGLYPTVVAALWAVIVSIQTWS